MKTRQRVFILLLLLIGAGVLLYQFSFSDGLINAQSRLPLEGHLAPGFKLVSTEGKTVTLKQLQGKPLLLNFWASWCGPCQIEMPDLVEAEKRFGNQVQFVGINLTKQDSREDAERFIQQYRVTYLNLFDDKGKAAKDYQITGIPTSFVLDETGQITYRKQGPMSLKEIEQVLSEVIK
ncbi:MAG: hypothetical protein BAA01_12575 [Bacillus thermozeamaize]|jgi:thiol-disulfide isomerase/thioredoxin|uniref:Thioredoxin domain-containing protein n=1 Tax=Bacillus thermozeamaize TaxID=230954 RepID=A0A1Y3PJ99_9BACI|nr:MAG: hypothetical protein BAA01_12575 [Bacillus thermozeamaize]